MIKAFLNRCAGIHARVMTHVSQLQFSWETTGTLCLLLTALHWVTKGEEESEVRKTKFSPLNEWLWTNNCKHPLLIERLHLGGPILLKKQLVYFSTAITHELFKVMAMYNPSSLEWDLMGKSNPYHTFGQEACQISSLIHDMPGRRKSLAHWVGHVIKDCLFYFGFLDFPLDRVNVDRESSQDWCHGVRGGNCSESLGD